MRHSGNYYSDHSGKWYVETLWKLAEKQPAHRISVRWLFKRVGLGIYVRSMADSREEREQVIHADLRYPIIFESSGHLADGFHRLTKAWLMRKRYIWVKILPEMPPSDRIRVLDHL